MMAELKTKKTKNSVPAFIKTVPRDKQADCKAISEDDERSNWRQASNVGCFDYWLWQQTPRNYASGRELDWFIIGFSPRNREFSLHVLTVDKKMAQLLKKLGPHKTGKACLYIKSLEVIDVNVLQQICNLASASSESGCGSC